MVNELDGFSTWLESGRGADNVVAFSGSEVNLSANRIYIEQVVNFLDFLNRRYTTKKYINFQSVKDENSACLSIDRLIQSKSDDLTIKGSNVKNNKYKSLTVYQLKALKAVFYPHTAKKHNLQNPFKDKKLSFRNYLISILFYEYGLRRGELHLLTTKSFNVNSRENYCYLVITNCEDGTKKKNDSSIKTLASHRTLRISQEHYEELRFYVEKIRKETESDRLFPITSRMINLIFQKATKAVHANFPETADKNSEEYIKSFYPHYLRHTWAVNQLAYLVDIEGKTLEEAKDLIRDPGGWSITSSMPDMYGARYIAMKGNQANIKRMDANKVGRNG